MNKLAKYCQTGIKISPSKKGTFTSQATKMGVGIQEAARTILNASEGRYTPLMKKKANFARNAKSWNRQQGGENGVIAEAGEFYKDENGQIKQVNPDTVTHDDYMLIDEQGNPISKMPYNKGGVVISGVQNVLSASHENRETNEPSYKKADEDIRIKPKEGKEFAKRFNFDNIKFNGGSPSKLFDSVLEAKTKKLKKYNNVEYNENSLYGINSSKANGAYVESLPQDEMIYDEIFDYQESKKQENLSNFMQTGGKGTLSPYPEMYGSKPVAMVNIKGKLYPASTVNGRTVSIDDVFNKRDSVELKNFKAIKLNKNERIKK